MIDRGAEFSVPVPLTAKHSLDDFQCGEPILDEWLRQRALSNMDMSASKTYVVCEAGSWKVSGFYALCMGHILNREATGSMRRNMPHQIPAVILGRLAVDRKSQGKGLGAALLRDAVRRSMRAAGEVSARLLIVHGISDAAAAFYTRHGFKR